MMLSEHKGALALAGRLFTRPGLPGHQTAKRGQKNRPSGASGARRTVPLAPAECVPLRRGRFPLHFL